MTMIKRKKRKERSLLVNIFTSLGACFCLLLLFKTFNRVKTGNEPSAKGDEMLKRVKQKQKHQQKQKQKPVVSNNSYHDLQNEDPIDLIKSGYLHLIDIDSPAFDCKDDDGEEVEVPYCADARFCHLEWSKHKLDPASVPMFKDLQQQSPTCRNTRVTLDLYTVVQAVKAYDETANENTDVTVQSLSPTGFVFHESRCGSTLVANSLAAFEPDKTRVYSESGPPIDAAKAFDMDFEKQSIQYLQDVIYLMGRTDNSKEENLFFKVQSIGSKSIWAFRKAFPTTPWIYVYREPVQVMKSHLKKKDTKRAVCLRRRENPDHDLKDLVKKIGGVSAGDLSTEEYCAAHLASLCEAAEKEIVDSNGLGKPVNYVELPTRLIEEIIPKHFLGQQSALHSDAVARILKVNEKYSKGRKTNKSWKKDSQEKENSAWEEMKVASATYMQPVYDRMEAIRLGAAS